MKYRVTSLTIIASLTGLLTALGCGGSSASDETDLNSEGSALTRGAASTRSASAAAADDDEDEDDRSDNDADEEAADDEEENDRLVCTVDSDCDSDEVCTNGLCSDPPGQADDEDGAVCEADDDDEDEADDEEENDRIVCTVDSDCDSDEVCTDGLCSDP